MGVEIASPRGHLVLKRDDPWLELHREIPSGGRPAL
jgi:hypothetical protein